MRQLSGQALRCAHFVARVALGVGMVTGVAVLLLAWRLSHGPLQLPMVIDLLERSGLAERIAPGVEIGSIALAWDGFQAGNNAPLQLLATDIRLKDTSGRIRQELPDAKIHLSVAGLFQGRFAPITVALQGPRIVLERDVDGDVRLALERADTVAEPEPASDPANVAPPDDILQQAFGPALRNSLIASLVDVTLDDGSLVMLDRQLGITWRMENVAIELRRDAGGGAVHGQGQGDLMLPGFGEAIPVSLSGRIEGDASQISGALSIPTLRPQQLATLLPALAPAAMLDAPVSIQLSGQLDSRHGAVAPELSLRVQALRGHFRIKGQVLGFNDLRLVATGTPTKLHLGEFHLEVSPQRAIGSGAARPAVVLDASGDAALEAGQWRARLNLGTGIFTAAQLSDLWPAGIADGARKWVTENITAGTLKSGRFTMAAQAGEDLSAFKVTDLSGTLRMDGGVVHWLRPIPPLEGVAATARFGQQEIIIETEAAREAGSALVSPGATIRLLGLDTNQEQAEIDARLSGPVADAVALIKHPRLKLFDQRPLDLKDPSGSLTGRLQLSFPLKNEVPADQFRVRFQAKLNQLGLADVLVGKALERGTADLSVDNARLRATGRAQIAGVNTSLGLEMEFRAGPASQIVERIRATAQPDARQLAAFGLDLDGFVSGPVAVQALAEKRRDGAMKVMLDGDLRDSTMELSALAWRKPRGQPGNAQAQLSIADGKLEAVRSLQIKAPDLEATGSVAFDGASRLERVSLSNVRVFAGRFSAEFWPPAAAAGAGSWRLRASGPLLDLGPLLAETGEQDLSSATADASPVTMDGHFDTVLLGNDRRLSAVQGRAALDRRGLFREARITGQAGEAAGFDLSIIPTSGGRSLKLNAADAGALLRAFDIATQIEGGRLNVDARWTGSNPQAPLTGTADMSDFRFQNATAVGKLLQALTVYGVFDAVRGPGLAFSRMIAPFSLTPATLRINNARAFSSSLGLTARGTLARRERTIDVQGTIVPAYALNSLLGYIPLLGRLFSPERGGGLFAATWRMEGSLNDPSVTLNPLAALTPGILRGLFTDEPGNPSEATPR